MRMRGAADFDLAQQRHMIGMARLALPPNTRMEPTCQSATPVAFARAAPLGRAAHARRGGDE